jgi:hypothetical protein
MHEEAGLVSCWRELTCLDSTGALNCFQYFPSAVSRKSLAGYCLI